VIKSFVEWAGKVKFGWALPTTQLIHPPFPSPSPPIIFLSALQKVKVGWAVPTL